MTNSTVRQEKPLFPLGATLATPAALNVLEKAEISAGSLFDRHICGDWGDLDQNDKNSNDDALKSGASVFSSYDLPTKATVWIITEADRSATTILLPSEY
jgi:hypothetical protein